MLTRKKIVPETVWDYATFHTELAGGYGGIETLRIRKPMVFLLRWHDGQCVRLSRTAKHWCIVYVPARPSQPFRLFTHLIITRERALPGDPPWRLQAMPHVPDDTWEKRITEDVKRLRSATSAIELGVIADELLEYRF